MDLDYEEFALGLYQLEDKGLSVDLKLGGARNLRVKSLSKSKDSRSLVIAFRVIEEVFCG